ncbi:DUF2332 domain-containing protein [Roseobacter ponti]|uniref:DUF2332 family protein n=1 Tax=Roseobacter ponti TaxID=1891787 RepID=A0A858SVU8_9RHOB|nr:DUF2332 family protein [Roseobacter ponti]QJF52118.1 DUF2332 family protein [Roseobacter ponti]
MTLARAFADQAISCGRLGSPFMQQLLSMLSAHWPGDTALAAKFAAFSGDIGPAGHSLPLRLAGGLHALVLTGRAPELAALYPPSRVSDHALREGVLDALGAHEAFLLNWVESPPQTNEVRRSAALMAGATVVAQHSQLPVVLSELGASGGLNLMWDHYALDLSGGGPGTAAPVVRLTPEWEGPLPPTRLPVVAERAGVDLNPLDPQNPDDLLRLTAYLWPDQPHRLAMTRAAAGVMTARIDRADAIDWLEQRLTAAPDGHLHLIQHTVAWQYFPEAARARGLALIEAAGAAATHYRPLAWLSMESEGDVHAAEGAALVLRFWPGDVTLRLGRADFHGRWIRWQGGV